MASRPSAPGMDPGAPCGGKEPRPEAGASNQCARAPRATHALPQNDIESNTPSDQWPELTLSCDGAGAGQHQHVQLVIRPSGPKGPKLHSPPRICELWQRRASGRSADPAAACASLAPASGGPVWWPSGRGAAVISHCRSLPRARVRW